VWFKKVCNCWQSKLLISARDSCFKVKKQNPIWDLQEKVANWFKPPQIWQKGGRGDKLFKPSFSFSLFSTARIHNNTGIIQKAQIIRRKKFWAKSKSTRKARRAKQAGRALIWRKMLALWQWDLIFSLARVRSFVWSLFYVIIKGLGEKELELAARYRRSERQTSS
jgi:hypothetical protein